MQIAVNNILLSAMDVDVFTKQIVEKTAERVVELLIEKTNNDKADQLLTQKEAAKMLRISAVTLSAWERAGRLKSKLVGKRRYYQYADIMTLGGNVKYKRK